MKVGIGVVYILAKANVAKRPSPSDICLISEEDCTTRTLLLTPTNTTTTSFVSGKNLTTSNPITLVSSRARRRRTLTATASAMRLLIRAYA